MTKELNKEFDSFVTNLAEFSVKNECIKTSLGNFILRRSGGVQGRNPRTGEPLPTTGGKTFKYFLVSTELFTSVFTMVDPSSVKEGQNQEIARMASRDFDANSHSSTVELKMSVALFNEIAKQLRTEMQFSIPEWGSIKAFNGPPAMIYLNPAG